MRQTRRATGIGSSALACAVAVSATATLGCASRINHYVLASTGTSIGVDISQDPKTQMYYGKLGYNRGEVALVPTNRGICMKQKSVGAGVPLEAGSREESEAAGGDQAAARSGEWYCTDNYKGGASDTTDVLMELRYQGIFSFTANGGIYQRLAVGKNAVQSQATTLMFAKSNAGNVTDDSVGAVKALAEPEIVVRDRVGAAQELAQLVSPGGTVSEDKVRALFECAGRNEATATRIAARFKGKSSAEAEELFSRSYSPEVVRLLADCSP